MVTNRYRIVVIGAGPGGICAAVRLLEAGYDDFVILEKAAGIGGTWWRNRYPGLSCDLPSHIYSFSFNLKPDWTRPYSPQPEILEYMQHTVEAFGVMPHVRLNTAVRGAVWDEADATWTVQTDGGEEIVCDVLISGTGMFGEAVFPDIGGRDSFQGTSFHTSEWDEEHPLDGERVAVIGSAASAVQLVPRIAPLVGRLYVFQRSANWVLPKEDAPFTPEQIKRFVSDRSALEAERQVLHDRIGSGFPFVDAQARQACEQAGLGNISVVTDPELRDALTPTTPWGCQRPLFSNEYYPTFNRENVELVTNPIARIVPKGVECADGSVRNVDTIIFATGYQSTRYISALDIVGRDGVSIDKAWREGAHAYLGVTTPGFPNLFMLYGPNTNHGSIIVMIEYQVDHIVRLLQRMDAEHLASIEVRHDAADTYDRDLQKSLDEVTVWDAGCHQYYRVASGRIVTQWPHSMYMYRDLLEADPPHAYSAKARKAGG